MRIIPLAVFLALSACASSTTTQLARNVVRIDVSAAPVCGSQGARRMVTEAAAIETIRNGYDRYYITGMDSQNNIRVVGSTQQTSGNINTYGNYGSYSGSTNTLPIYGGTQDAAVVAVMFAANDPEGKNAIDARQVLGADWRERVAKGIPTTCT